MTSTAFQTPDTLTVVDTTPTVVDASARLTARTTAGILVGVLAVAAVSAGAAHVARSSASSPAATTTNAASGTGTASWTTTDAAESGHGGMAEIVAARVRAAEHAAATSPTSMPSRAKLAEVLRLSSS